jgi:hypothetical protein
VLGSRRYPLTFVALGSHLRCAPLTIALRLAVFGLSLHALSGLGSRSLFSACGAFALGSCLRFGSSHASAPWLFLVLSVFVLCSLGPSPFILGTRLFVRKSTASIGGLSFSARAFVVVSWACCVPSLLSAVHVDLLSARRVPLLSVCRVPLLSACRVPVLSACACAHGLCAHGLCTLGLCAPGFVACLPLF